MKLMNQQKDHTDRIKTIKSVLFTLLFLPFSVQADELGDLYAKLNTTIISPATLEEAIVAGEERASVCKFCHGPDGNSRRNYIPNLAEQNPKYLLKQFELFASKERNNRIMSELSKNLTGEDRINIALYYSYQKAKHEPALAAELAAGAKKIFQAKCATCHGDDAHGAELLPRLASQPAEYLNRTLNNYRSEPDFRPSSPMQAIVNTLNAADQATVTSYISTME